jgi:hypothetical protein
MKKEKVKTCEGIDGFQLFPNNFGIDGFSWLALERNTPFLLYLTMPLSCRHTFLYAHDPNLDIN